MDNNEYEDKMEEELAKLSEYHKAVREEFANENQDDEVIAEKAKRRVIELVPDAAFQIAFLINHADSEAIRKDLSKWVFQVAMKAAEEAGEDNPMKDLLKSLTAPN